MAVFLADEQQQVEVDGDELVALARHVMEQRDVPAEMELTLLLVDRETIAEMNERHLDREGPTDVLAFPIDIPGEAPPGAPAVLGDVVLCPDVAAEQAARAGGTEGGRTTGAELRMLAVHGILHLLGMDHATPDEEREMFGLTDRLLAGFASGGDAQGDRQAVP